MTSNANLIPTTATNWLIFCGQNHAPSKYYANGLSVGYGYSSTGSFNFGVNTFRDEKSEFAIMEISIWFRLLSEAEIQAVSSIYAAVLDGSLAQSFPTRCTPLSTQPRNLARTCGADSNQDCAATQSSTAAWLGMDASVVVDGCKSEEDNPSTDLFYGSHTGTDNYPWLRIDLATSRSVGSGQVWNRPGNNAIRLDGFQVWIGNSLTYNGAGNTNCYTATTTPHNSFPYLHYFPCVGVGRYFFVSLPRTGTCLHLREVEIYAPCSDGQSAVEPYVMVAHGYNSIRRLSVASGAVTTVVGSANGISGASDGTGTLGRFNLPSGVAVSPDGTFVLVADLNNHLIRRVDLFRRAVTTVAGSSSAASIRDGHGTSATFHSPYGIALYPDGLIAVVTEISGHTIRKISVATTQVTTLAGVALSRGSADGVGTNSQFN